MALAIRALNSQKRTHPLSNGEVIWDIAGNVWEWTSDVIFDNTDKPSGSGVDGRAEYYSVIDAASMAKLELTSNPLGHSNSYGALLRGEKVKMEGRCLRRESELRFVGLAPERWFLQSSFL